MTAKLTIEDFGNTWTYDTFSLNENIETGFSVSLDGMLDDVPWVLGSHVIAKVETPEFKVDFHGEVKLVEYSTTNDGVHADNILVQEVL